MQKANLELLISRKMQAKKSKLVTKEIYVPALDMNFTVQKLPLTKVLGILDKYNTGETSLVNNLEMSKELIYYSIPLLQNEKLQKEYDCVEPFDIVVAIFDENITTIGDLAGEISKFYGINNNQSVEELKN